MGVFSNLLDVTRKLEMPTSRPRFAAATLALGLICLALPALGRGLAGGRPALDAPPPFVLASRCAGFHWGAFSGFVLFSSVLGLAWVFGRKAPAAHPGPETRHRAASFPGWGWIGLGVGLAAWLAAWNRFAWFAALQRFTFILQWIPFIVVVNGLTVRRQGHCPLQREPRFLLRLFVASALFWWLFEYLNGFVHNWVYRDAGYHQSPLEYLLFGSLAFSTVLPGVYSMKRLLSTFAVFQRFSRRGPAVSLPAAGGLYLVPLLLVSTAFLLLGLYPDFIYPLVWIGPFAAWLSLKGLAGLPLGLGDLEQGDWSQVLGWALAALICGFFWEMWNFYSLSKWTYRVPYLQGFKVFEMPIAGYSGYLAFGLVCSAAVEIAGKLLPGRGAAA